MIRTPLSVILGALAAFAVISGGEAVLAAQSDGAKPSFEALDKNSDGKVTLNEAADNDALFVAFKSLDTNKDGVLSPEEFAVYQRDKPSA
jgi:Ca2+-binding EF-hand superfamily protein